MENTDNRTRAYAVRTPAQIPPGLKLPKGMKPPAQWEIAFLRNPTPDKIADVMRRHPEALDLTPTPMANAVWLAVGRINGHLYPF